MNDIFTPGRAGNPQTVFAAMKTIALTILVILAANPALAAVRAHVIDSDDQLLHGTQAAGSAGDVLLENDRIAIVISAIGHITGYGLGGGTIIDAGIVPERLDALQEIYPYFDDDWPRQAIYTSLEIVEDGSNGRAMVRVRGTDSEDSTIEVITEYSLEDGAAHLDVTTHLSNTGAGNYPSFECGDAFQWGNAATFAPGKGFAVGAFTSGPWIGAVAESLAYAYSGPEGTVWGPHGNGWSDLNTSSGSLGPGAEFSCTRYLAVGAQLGEVVATIHRLTGTPVGIVECRVRGLGDAPSIAGATVDVGGAAEGDYLQMRTDAEGLATTTLPPGVWNLSVSAPGFLSFDVEIEVLEDQTTAVEFELETDSFAPPLGDEITVIQRPLQNVPAFVLRGNLLEISCAADTGPADWEVELQFGGGIIELPLVTSSYDFGSSLWSLQVEVPEDVIPRLFDLRVLSTSRAVDDTATNAVRVLREYRDDYYFIQITDLHLPDHRFSSEDGSPEQHTEIDDLLEVIADINIINPEFVLVTGDVVNEGELEDYMNWRSFSRAQRALTEFEVPVFVVAGNHDLGGWSSTPPPDGTSRRNWWRFFGWSWLSDPPADVQTRTQDYSFDYGPVHFVGLEAYVNYDGWNWSTYGGESFTDEQMRWLRDDLALARGSLAQVLFFHYDFGDEIDLRELGVEMALYGHTHGDQGSLLNQPYMLGTRAVCDGRRAYRLIRVSDGVLTPRPTLSAGFSGKNLEVEYQPANDGGHNTVTALLTNRLGERFDHALLKFVMPAGTRSFLVTGGSLEHVDVSESSTICSVRVDIAAHAQQTIKVSVRWDPLTRPPDLQSE